jgi:hypothetical protein
MVRTTVVSSVSKCNILGKCIFITAYQICSCCTSSGRVVFVCCRKYDKVCNITKFNCVANVINQGRTRFISWKNKVEKESICLMPSKL